MQENENLLHNFYLTIFVNRKHTTKYDIMKKITGLLGLTLVAILTSCENFNLGDNNGDGSGSTPQPSNWTKYIDKLSIEQTETNGAVVLYEYTHTYDELDRISSVTENFTDDYDTETYVYTFDYSKAGEITATIAEDDYIETGRGIIGSNGVLSSLSELEDNKVKSLYGFKYDENKNLIGLTEKHQGYDEYTTELGYSDGMLINIDGEANIPSQYYKHKYTNDKINIDINWITLFGYGMEMPTMFAYTRNMGNLGNYIIESGNTGYESAEIPGTVMGGFTDNPNYREQQSTTYFQRADEAPETDMQFDEEGCPVKFTFKFKYEQYKEEWEYVAGDIIEMGDPEEPGSKTLYAIVATERVQTKTGVTKTCPIVYTFKYRDDK